MEFPKCLGIWEISQMPGYNLGNFLNAYLKKIKMLSCHQFNSTYLRSNAAEKRTFNIIIYQLLFCIFQGYLGTFSKIVFNPLKLWTSQQLSFCADQRWSITAVISFKINFKTTFHALLLSILIHMWDCLW